MFYYKDKNICICKINIIRLVILLYLLYCATGPKSTFSQIYQINSIVFYNNPIIKGDSISYTIDCFFKEKNINYFWFFDLEFNCITIEFFNKLIVPQITLPSHSPFIFFKIQEVESKLSLTKIISKIIIGIDKGNNNEIIWNYYVTNVTESQVRIIIWKKNYFLNVIKKEKRKKYLKIAISFISAIIITLTGIIIFYKLQNYNY